MRLIRIITLPALLLLTLSPVRAQTWIVPDDQKSVVAPMKFTPELQKQGEQVYLKNCQSCHGLPGKDNWAKLAPPPGDLAKEKAQANTDGEMFYKITAGKSPMPEFRNIIPEEDRWHIVAYIRSFNSKYVQPEPASLANFAGRIVTLDMKADETGKKITVTAVEKGKDGSTVPAPGVEVQLFAKRYFGDLPISEIKTTNALGTVLLDFPADLPGNKEGMVDLTAKVNDPKGLMKTTPAKGSFPLGIAVNKPGLTETRAWWSTRDKAPVWIAAVFTISVIIVWGFIIYILLSILKIRKLA
jgi:cytochrome c5